MNKLLIVCSAVALIYGECAFANVEDFDEVSESKELPKNNDVKDFGTKDQWQAFFESQGEPQQLFFLSRKEAEAIRKRKRERMDFLIKQLEALRTKDDITLLTDKLKELKIENEDKTGKLIDVDEKELHHSKRIKNLDVDQDGDRFNNKESEELVVKPFRSLRSSSKADESLKPDASQKRRVRLKYAPAQNRNDETQEKFAR